MTFKPFLGTALALSLVACTAAGEDTDGSEAETVALSAEALEAAVADTARPEAARALDEGRKPAEVLAF